MELRDCCADVLIAGSICTGLVIATLGGGAIRTSGRTRINRALRPAHPTGHANLDAASPMRRPTASAGLRTAAGLNASAPQILTIYSCSQVATVVFLGLIVDHLLVNALRFWMSADKTTLG
jgi:hypothetical protein